MNLLRSTRLFFREGNSDKVYEVDLCDLGARRGEARYLVNFRYGRRGATLREGTKTQDPVTLEQANKIFDSVVVSKTNKGYKVAESETTPLATSNTTDISSADLRAQTIIDKLTVAASKKKISGNEVKRAVWRAGELGLREAAVTIGQLMGRDDDLLDYCIAWSLGRCGDASTLPVLNEIRKRYGRNHVGNMAREAELALTDREGRESIYAPIRENLPDFIKVAIDSGQEQQVVSSLEMVMLQPIPENIDLIGDYYLLALDDSLIHGALCQFIPLIKLKPNSFKAVRRLFKTAEFRLDARLFGAIAHLIDSTTHYYRAPEYGDHAFDPESQRYLSVPKERKKKSPAFAFSNRTREYFRRRSWRTLKRLGDLQADHYVDFAVEMLLAVTDADARPGQVFEYYDYDRGTYVTHTYDRYGHLYAFNHILNANNPRIQLNTARKMWLLDESVAEVADFRSEAYPQLWDSAPQSLLRLLTESHCDAVHQFAVRALKGNREFIAGIGSEQVCTMLAMPYEETALFALEIARNLIRYGRSDINLVAALFQSPLGEARELARETATLNPSMLMEDADLAFAVITSEHEDNRLWLRRFAADHSWQAAMMEPLVARLIAGVIELGQDKSDHKALIRDISWMLVNSFGDATRNLGFEVITDLLNEKSAAVQLVGAQLVLNHAAPVEQLPPDILRRLLEAKSADVRALGTQLFGRLSDEALLAQPALVIKLVLSHDAQVRKAASPIIQRLASFNQEFAATALTRLMDSLFRSEPEEGFHDDIIRLINEGLGSAADSIDADTTWRLLQARSKGAQRYGSHMLQRWTPNDFSIRQLGRLAGNPILAVRQWAWQGYEQQLFRIKTESRDAMVIFDTRWSDTREFAMQFFDNHFGENDWNPELLIDICDSTLDDVQDYGRRLITRFFDEQDGVNYLLKLSQHPSNKVQLFVSQFLQQYAADNTEHLYKLRFYFLTVLSKVNQARVTKNRITAFLRDEAMKSRPAAQFVVDIFSRQSVTSAIVDKSDAIDMLLRIRSRYPELESPLNLVETRAYTADKEEA